MSKYGVEAFSDGLRYELKPYGISVHLIEPGMVKTNILSPKLCTDYINHSWEKLNDETKKEYGQEYKDERKLTLSERSLAVDRFLSYA